MNGSVRNVPGTTFGVTAVPQSSSGEEILHSSEKFAPHTASVESGRLSVASAAAPICGKPYPDHTWFGDDACEPTPACILPARMAALSMVVESENAVHAPTGPWSLIGPSRFCVR